MYREEGLALRRKKPKRRRAAMARHPRPQLTRMNERWTMGFMSDALAYGQQLRVLTVVDAYTRECLALEGATHFRGADVARVLSRVVAGRGRPSVIACDNGTEFTSRSLGLDLRRATRLQSSRQADRQCDDRSLQRQRAA